MNGKIGGLVCMVVMGAALYARADSPPAASSETVITSDELEFLDNGARTVFTGHVVLTQEPNQLLADRMVKIKSTGNIEAEGHVHGTWKGDKGEKSIATGRNALYRPSEKITELWGNAKMTRWETAVDTRPVTVTADHFTAFDNDHTVYAKGHVHMEQKQGLRTWSDEAKYDQTAQTITLWGVTPVLVHWEDAKGSADFKSERAWLLVSPKRVKLIKDVHGHIIPAS